MNFLDNNCIHVPMFMQTSHNLQLPHPLELSVRMNLIFFKMCNCVHVYNFEVPCIVLGVQESVDTDVSVHGSGCGLHGDLHGTAVSSPHVH